MDPLADARLDLVELLAMSDQPLYSSFRYFQQRSGMAVSMQQFLDQVERLAAEGMVLRVESREGHPSVIDSFPSELADRYAKSGHADRVWDPFELYLAPGPNAPRHDPEWRLRIDHEAGTFEASSRGDPEEALEQAAQRLSPARLVIRERFREGDTTLIRGEVIE